MVIEAHTTHTTNNLHPHFQATVYFTHFHYCPSWKSNLSYALATTATTNMFIARSEYGKFIAMRAFLQHTDTLV